MSTKESTPDYISKQVEMSRLFFLSSSPDDAFSVSCGGYERCRPDYRIDRKGLPWYCLEFVSRGSGSLKLAGKTHELKAGSYFLYAPGMAHRIQSSDDHPLGKYFVAFQGAEVEAFLKSYELAAGTVGHCRKAESVRRGFDMLIERGVRKSRLSEPLCSLMVRELLLLCLDDSSGAVDTESLAYASYSRALNFIKEQYLTLSSLEAVAKGCGVEAAYLCRLFARYHDESPYQFLTRLRMEHASRLLLEDEASVRSVSEAMGYKDPFHFSRVFKSVHRVPPSRFRNAMHA